MTRWNLRHVIIISHFVTLYACAIHTPENDHELSSRLDVS